jgi:hypothetical protein
MRTTVDIEDSLLKRLRKEARRRGVSFKALLSSIIRHALSEPGTSPVPSQARYRCPTYSMGAPIRIDLDKAFGLATALEDAETAREIAVG